jgi:hypothetical protein
MHLESRKLAPGAINVRLGVVRRLAYEAADCGLLSPDLAAGIRRVKGVKLGVHLGNWLTGGTGDRSLANPMRRSPQRQTGPYPVGCAARLWPASPLGRVA